VKNNYPIEFIRKQLNKRLHKLKSQNPGNSQVKEKPDMRCIVFPRVKNLNHKLKRLFNKSEFKLICKPANKLNEQIIKRGKDKIPISQEQGVVYKVNCKNCDSCYIGQTKRSVETRMKEHESNIRSTSNKRSVISEHRIRYNHNFNWKNVKILDKEPNYFKRLVSEMIHIKKKTRLLINKQTLRI